MTLGSELRNAYAGCEERKKNEFYSSLPDKLMAKAERGAGIVSFDSRFLMDNGTSLSELSYWCRKNDISYCVVSRVLTMYFHDKM